MSCQRARQIDREQFLLEPGAPELDSFRAHFPTCPACSRALADWTAFDLALHGILDEAGDGTMAHPLPDRIETYLSAGTTAGLKMGVEAMMIEKHLAICPSCRTEVAVLSQFESGFLATIQRAAAIEGHAGSHVDDRSGLLDRLRGWLDSWPFDFLATAPAFAMVVVLGFGLWWSGVLSPGGERTMPDGSPKIVEREGVIESAPRGAMPSSLADAGQAEDRKQAARSDESEPPDSQAEGGRAPAALELAQAGPDASDPASAPQVLDGDRRRIVEGSSTAGTNGKQGTRSASAETAADLAETEPRDEVLLAALTEMPLPSYSVPEDVGSVSWMRQFGAVRGGPQGARVEVRAPSTHVGLTLSESPRLWWSLSQDTDLPIQVTISDDRKLEPLLRVELTGPFSKGLQVIDLARYGVKLEPEVDYRWFVSLIVDADRPSRNPVAAGALREISMSDSRRKAALASLPSERGHTLARLGLWYDAFDFFASISADHPEFEPVARHRERLVELAGSHH